MRTIVVIEDQPVLAAAYRNKFAGEGFNVEVAHDGEPGLDLIIRTKPDLVLLDMHLPTMNGLAVLKKIRSMPEFQMLPVIVFSNLTKPGAVEEAWQAGATMVLSKLNTSPNRVVESVKTTLAAGVSAIVNATLPTDMPPAPTRASSTTSPPPTRGNILLVENHSDMAALLAFLLQRAGHQVTNVPNAAAALQQISQQSFELFVLGGNCTNIPVRSLCQQLRQAHPDKPIVVYATAALFSEQQLGLKAGATAYLAKAEDIFNLGQIASDLMSSPVQIAPSHIRAA